MRNARGFTVLELMTVTAIMGIMLALAATTFAERQRLEQVRSEVQRFEHDVQLAQRWVRHGGKGIGTLTERVRSAGIFFEKDGYRVFVDADVEPGDEIEVVRRSFARSVSFREVPDPIRFVGSGTLEGGADRGFEIFDSETGTTHHLDLSYAGQFETTQSKGEK